MNQMASTFRQEIEIGRRNTPDFGTRTLLLEAELFALFVASTWATLAGVVPMWLGALGNTVFFYAIYTVVHEAVHSNISSRSKKLRWIDTIAGVIASVPLWLHYHQHKRQHMQHHAHTNEDSDPDIYARGDFLSWIFVRLPVTLLNYFNPFELARDCQRYNLPRREVIYTAISFSAYSAIILGLIVAGYWRDVLFLWFAPWWIGQTMMLTFFTWTPHHDHSETGRYRNTRVSLFPGANFLLQGQNYHLIHHMIPSIPYYRYKPTFDEMRPLLEQNGVRIEGLVPDPKGEHQAAI